MEEKIENQVEKPISMEDNKPEVKSDELSVESIEEVGEGLDISEEDKALLDEFDKEVEVKEPVQETQQVEQPKESSQQPPMVDMTDIEVGELSDTPSEDVRLKEGDFIVEFEGEEHERVVSNKFFEIEDVNYGIEYVSNNIKNKVPMTPFNPEKPESIGYVTKLRLKYKDTSYISIIPKIRWYYDVQNKKVNPWFNTKVTSDDMKKPLFSTIAKHYYKYCNFVKKEVGKVTLKEFVEGLKGRKVYLTEAVYDQEGKKSYRLDILKFVE